MRQISVQKFAVGAFFLLLAFPLLPIPEYWITLANYIGLYTLPALGLVILTGVSGLTSFGQATFVGVGAYASAILTLRYGLSPWIGLPVGLVLTLTVAWVIGTVTLRISGHYLSLATMAWSLAAVFFVGNVDFMGGYDGMSGIPALALGSVSFESGRSMFFLVWICVAAAMLLTANLLSSRSGRAMRSLRAGEVMAPAMGINVPRSKMTAFLIAAFFASVSGWLYAHLQRAINPTPFGINYGIEYLLMAVAGGAGHIVGAIVGAVIVTVLRELLTSTLPALTASHINLDSVVFGCLLIYLLQRFPQGLWPVLSRYLPKPVPKLGERSAVALPKRQTPASGARILEVDGLRKVFGGLTAVGGVSFHVHAGEIVALIGPNGAGKSTTFNLISGADAMTAGAVSFMGAKLENVRASDISRRGLSRTFQHVQLMPDLSALENVCLGAHCRVRGNADGGALGAMLRLNRAEEQSIQREATAQLERVGLGAFAHVAAGSLSLGQQRLVEIARALCSDPTLLLLDEPAAGLRLQEKGALARLLRQLRSEGMGVLIVEHDMGFLMNIADRVVVMEFGQKIADDVPMAIQNDPRVRKAYLGSEEDFAGAAHA